MNQNKTIRNCVSTIIGTGVLLAGVSVCVVALLVYSGAYNVAADAPHTKPVYEFLKLVRERSIAVRASSITVPSGLDDQKRILAGAGLYHEMCSGCHLGPGLERTEISQGLNPQAPLLAKVADSSPAEEFWVIKHGIKMTGMAAWGPTHNDTLIWDMVAFLQKLPHLTAAEYQAMIKNAPEDHDEVMHDMHTSTGDDHQQ